MNSSDILFVVILVVVVAALVIWIATITSRAKRMSTASDARLAAELANLAQNPPAAPKPFDQETPAERSAQVIAMAEDDDESPAQIAATTKAERLTELTGLHAKGAISDDELAAARAKILAE